MRFLALFILFSQFAVSQTTFKGKVDTDVFPPSILIVNNSTKETVHPKTDGTFSITANSNDLIVFASERTEGLTIKIEKKHLLNSTTLYIKTIPIEISEIEIKKYPHINAVSLGIIPKDIKTFTKAERKLNAINNNISIEGLFKSVLFTSEKRNLKIEIENEKNEKFRENILNHYSEDFFKITLGISQEYINGFLIFVLDDKNVVHLFEQKNYNAVQSILKEKTLLYLQRIHE